MMKKRKKIDGYLKNNCLQPRMLYQRHKDIENEMKRRGYNHKSNMCEVECACVLDLPLEKQYWEIDKNAALKDLLDRCPQCRQRNEEKLNDNLKK